MTTLITGDLHWSHRTIDSYRNGIVDRLIRVAKEQHVNRFIVLGDLTEAKDRHASELVNSVAERIAKLAEFAPVIILSGNHDGTKASSPFFHFLRFQPNVEFISTPTIMRLSGLDRCCFLPYTRAHEKEWKGILNKDIAWFFAHQSFAGADYGNGFVGKSGPSLRLFPEGSHVISGDIHNPQTYTDERRKLTYVGSPYTVDFGDEWEPRVLILKRGLMRSVHIPGPQKRLIVQDKYDKSGLSSSLTKGDVFKIVVRGVDRSKISAVTQEINAMLGDEGIMGVVNVSTHVEHVPLADIIHNAIRSVSDTKRVRSYAGRRGMSDREIDTAIEIVKSV